MKRTVSLCYTDRIQISVRKEGKRWKHYEYSYAAATIDARSESQISAYISKIDVLLLGPHYANEVEHFRQAGAPYGVVVDVIPDEIYGMVDGKGLVELAVKMAGRQ